VAVFITRRMIISFFILLVSTFLVYVLVALSGDPLADLRQAQTNQREALIQARIDVLNLDQPIPVRYAGWLAGVAQCAIPFTACDLGLTRDGQQVTVLVAQAVQATFQLVLASTFLAMFLGIGIGIVSALRQYSGLDYTVTFTAFLFFSLPIFWIAVLLKQYGAIRFNDWLRAPTIAWWVIVVVSLLSAFAWAVAIGGARQRRLLVGAVAAGVTALVLFYLSATEWFATPGLGLVGVAVLAFGAAVGVTALVSGLERRPVLNSTLATAAVGVVSYLVLGPIIGEDTNAATIGLLLLITLAISLGIGFLLGGLDKGQAARAAAITGVLTAGVVFMEFALQAVPAYTRSVRGTVLATIGSNTPNYAGTFWETFLDTVTHLILPTLAIMLISFATYSRYTRANMLESMQQDFVRTARSKGLTERTVVMRHGFRNTMIPITTLVAFDFGAVIGGAVITETVFGWRGMGALFREGLTNVDPNPVMGFYIVTAVAIVVFNMLADIAYAYLDPRIRLS
jgi:peptide/nickel transport system permease protein